MSITPPTLVSHCRNYINGECKYGESDCWFMHGENKSETEDIMQKIFGVMKKMISIRTIEVEI